MTLNAPDTGADVLVTLVPLEEQLASLAIVEARLDKLKLKTPLEERALLELALLMRRLGLPA